MASGGSLEEDLYDVLGITPAFPCQAVRGVRNSLSKLYHPDTGAQPDAARMARINAAADILADPEKRKEYDRGRKRRHEEAEAAAKARRREAAAAAARAQRARAAANHGAGQRFQDQAGTSRRRTTDARADSATTPPQGSSQPPPGGGATGPGGHASPTRTRLSLIPAELHWYYKHGGRLPGPKLVSLDAAGPMPGPPRPTKSEGTFWALREIRGRPTPTWEVALKPALATIRAGSYREDVPIRCGTQVVVLAVMVTVTGVPSQTAGPSAPWSKADSSGSRARAAKTTAPSRPGAKGPPTRGVVIGAILIVLVVAVIAIAIGSSDNSASSTTGPASPQSSLPTLASTTFDVEPQMQLYSDPNVYTFVDGTGASGTIRLTATQEGWKIRVRIHATYDPQSLSHGDTSSISSRALAAARSYSVDIHPPPQAGYNGRSYREGPLRTQLTANGSTVNGTLVYAGVLPGHYYVANLRLTDTSISTPEDGIGSVTTNSLGISWSTIGDENGLVVFAVRRAVHDIVVLFGAIGSGAQWSRTSTAALYPSTHTMCLTTDGSTPEYNSYARRRPVQIKLAAVDQGERAGTGSWYVLGAAEYTPKTALTINAQVFFDCGTGDVTGVALSAG